MAKRMTKAEAQFWGMLIMVGVLVGLPIYAIKTFGDAIGWHWFAFLIVAGVVGYIVFQVQKAKAKRAEVEASRLELVRQEEANRVELQKQLEARHAALTTKYSDKKIVDDIMRGAYWQGQTAEQLLDSLGQPADIDEKVLKTRKREIWKYHQLSANRFGLRITVENDVVAGWDEKM